jgi:hypothetical protein
MPEGTSTVRAVLNYVLSPLASLLTATLAVLPFGGSPEPGTIPRLVWVVVFFGVFTLLFALDSGYPRR